MRGEAPRARPRRSRPLGRGLHVTTGSRRADGPTHSPPRAAHPRDPVAVRARHRGCLWELVLRLRALALALSLGALAACTAPPTLGEIGSDEQAATDDETSPKGGSRDANSPEATSSAKGLLDARRLDLGEVGDGDEVTVDVGGDDVGFVVTATGPSGLGIVRVTSPSKRVVFDGFTKVGTTQATGRAQGGTASIAVPSTSEATTRIERGAWKVTFAGAGTGTAHARVQVAPGGTFVGAVLDLHLWIPDGLRISGPSPEHAVVAARAASDTDLRARVDAFFEALETVTGIERGDVTFHAAPAELRLLDTDAKLERAGALPPAGANGQALHVVVTNDILNGAAMGFSPGMPGAVGLGGTAASAIFAAHLEGVDARTDALTWFHEMGHFVGLHHTSELDGAMFDPLSDTPRCPGQRTQSTRCPDEGNLMFTGAFAPVPRLSASQLAILRASPISRAKAAPGR